MSFLVSRQIRITLLVLGLAAVILPLAAHGAVGSLDYYTLQNAPCRILDTRLPKDAPNLQAGIPRNVDVAGVCGVPEEAVAVSLNVTAITPTVNGFLSLYPSDATVPADPGTPPIPFASLPYHSGLNRAKVLLVGVGADGNMTANASAGQVHLVIDVSGYFLGAKAVADSTTVNEDASAATINVLANDLNPNTDTLGISAVTQPANGTVAITNSGADLTYQPNPDYCNNPPGTTLDTFTYTLSPSNSIGTVTVTVTCQNDAPVVTTTAGATAFTENGGPVVVDSGVTVTDVDNANLASATVTITNPQDGASEVLAAAACAGLTLTPGLNTLSITGSQPIATYQTCLQSVTYDNISQNPDGTTRIISFVVNDGTANSAAATKDVAISAVANAPVVTTTAGTTPFVEDGGAVVIDSGVTVTDPDSANLASATVTITNPLDGASEVLGATACAGLTVTPGLNTLGITGNQPKAAYQTCLQSVTYNNTSQNPNTTARVIAFVANDGTVNSTTANKTVTVAAATDAPVVTTTGGTTAFTEDGGAVVVDSGLTVSDPDSANLASATVTITNPLDGASEVLGATACAGLTVTPGLNTLSITGSQPVATYQTCLRSVTYDNSSQNPGTTARIISFVANDGALSSSAATKTVTVAPASDAPVVTTTVGTTAFTEDGGAVVVDSGVTVTDVDSANLASATVTITNPQDGASEVLAATACAGLTVTPGINTLSITGSQPPATYQTCLQSVTYNNTSQNPGTTARVISFVANDGSVSSSAATKTVTVAALNDAPVVTTTVGTTAFAEDGGAVVVDSGLTVTDADSANLASASVTITNPQDGASEVLGATTCAGLTVTPGLNTLSITGSQPVAAYQACLRSVTYNNTSQNPGTTARIISFTANDGALTSSAATKTLTVAAVADAPVVTTTVGTTAFTEDGGAVVVDSGVTVADADSANLASATVTITNPQNGASEVLGATCAGLTVTPGLNSLSITGSQTVAAYQACLQSVTYNNTSQNPGTTARVISFVANDGAASSSAATKTVTVAAVPDAPVVTTTVGATSFTEDGGAVVVDSGLTVTDADSANLASATVAITNPQDGASEVLGATACAGLTVTPGLNTLSITGSQPVAAYQTCLRSVTYNNTSNNPGTTARVISFVANDGAVSSSAATKTVTVAASPDAPVVTTTVGTTSFTEDGGAVVVDSGVTVTDPDSTNLASATVTITNPQDGASETLSAACAGLTVTPGLNTLSITGSQPTATYQTCLQSVTYNNSSQNPGTTPRIISFVANDGALNSSAATKTVTVTSVPDAPVVTTTAGTTSFTEDGGAVVVDSGVSVSDVDSANLASATVTITNPGPEGAAETLAASACAGLTVTPGLNTLSITGSQPLGTYQTCLRSVTYNNSSQNPSAVTRVVSFVVNDGSLSSSAATKSVSVTPVPDPPVPTTNPISYSTAGNVQLHVKGRTLPGVVSIADAQGILEKAGPFSDPDGPAPASIVAANGTTANGGSYDIATDGSFTYVPAAGFTGTDTFSYQATDGLVSASYTVNVTVGTRVWFIRDVIDSNNAAGGDGRSTNPFDTITAFNAALTNDNDMIFVFYGNTGTTPLSGGIILKNGQKLHGEGIGLTVAPFGTLVSAKPTFKPRISNTSGDAVSVPAATGNRQNVEIRGLNLSGSVNAVDVTASGANQVGVTISDNDITAAGVEGIDLNAGSTGAFTATLSNNAIAATGNAFDARTSAATTMTLDFSNNSAVSNATAILIDGAGGGTTTITGFANNAVSGATGGTGISVNAAKFDATPGGTFQVVSGGTTVVGSSGDRVGGGGVVMTSVSGDLSFTDLDIFAGQTSGVGLQASSTAAYTGSAGFQITIGSGVSTVSANGGPAVDLTTVTGNLPFQQITSTNSATTGVALNSFLGTFTAPSGSSISGSSGTGFQVGSSNATVTYNGTVTTTAGKGVDLTSNTGSTISFTGTLTLSSGSNTAFNATGGGTVTSTDTTSTLTSTTGTALNVANTTIGSSGMTFRSISANGASKGISLNNTGTAAGNGGLSVTGTGSTDGSGGTIQSISARGGEFIGTKALSLKNMNFTNANTTDGGTCTDLSTAACNAAIYLNGVATVTLDNINVTGTTAQQGINGLSVSNFTLSNSTLANCGSSGGVEEGCIKMRELTGTCSIADSDLSFPGADVAEIVNTTGPPLTLNVSNSTFRDSQSSSAGNTGLQVRSEGTANVVVNVTNSSFLRIRTVGLHATAINTASNDVDVTSSTFDPGTGTMIGLDLDADQTGNLVFNVQGNTKIYSRNGPAINVFGDTSATINGRIKNNTDVQVKSNAGSNVGSGIRANINKNATAKLEITGNVVNVGSDDAGIDLSAIGKTTANPGGGTNTLDATVTGNNVTIGATSTYGIIILSATNAGDTNALCANVGTNAITRNASSISSFRARVPSASGFFRMEGFSSNAETTWNSKGNTPTSAGGSEVSFGGSGTFAVCTAALPTNPGLN